jgi:putative hydrolase of the HAD superfamily
MRHDKQILVFDADDTLWENNRLFEQVIEAYLSWLDHPTLDRSQLRSALDAVERANSAVHGYGSQALVRSLGDCLAQVRGRPATREESAAIQELAAALADHHVELIPDVADTLAALADRHTLLMLTKGDPQEQRRKIDASQLAHHFQSVDIVREKDGATYRRFLQERALAPADSWMIGNSPKSDILPAREAGMRAVFIPNTHTWVLEHTDLDPADDGVLHLRAFRDLLDHF